MSRLVRLYASNLLKPEAITSTVDNLATSNQLADENLGLETNT